MNRRTRRDAPPIAPAPLVGTIAGIAMIAAAGSTTTARATIDPRAPLDDACWDESFVEEFDALDLVGADGTGRWTTRYIWPRDVIINEELQYYLDPATQSPSPFSVADGVLAIEARPTPPALADEVGGQPYTSGVLTTRDSFSQLHGRFEAVARVPAGKGLWSALWLLPTHERWPEGVAVLPEIDIMEHIGDAPRTFHTTLHTNQHGRLDSHPYDHTGDADLTAGFHRYSVVWTPEAVHWVPRSGARRVAPDAGRLHGPGALPAEPRRRGHLAGRAGRLDALPGALPRRERARVHRLAGVLARARRRHPS